MKLMELLNVLDQYKIVEVYDFTTDEPLGVSDKRNSIAPSICRLDVEKVTVKDDRFYIYIV